jgi:hypothetical protein
MNSQIFIIVITDPNKNGKVILERVTRTIQYLPLNSLYNLAARYPFVPLKKGNTEIKRVIWVEVNLLGVYSLTKRLNKAV